MPEEYSLFLTEAHWLEFFQFLQDVLEDQTVHQGPVSQRPRKVFHPESPSKILNLLITVLLYSHILNMNRDVLGVYSSLFDKNCFAGPKCFRDFREVSACVHRSRSCRGCNMAVLLWETNVSYSLLATHRVSVWFYSDAKSNKESRSFPDRAKRSHKWTMVSIHGGSPFWRMHE